MLESEAAYDSGWVAYRSGKPRSENPHKEGTEEHYSWMMGWVQGEWDSYVPSDDHMNAYLGAQ